MNRDVLSRYVCAELCMINCFPKNAFIFSLLSTRTTLDKVHIINNIVLLITLQQSSFIFAGYLEIFTIFSAPPRSVNINSSILVVLYLQICCSFCLLQSFSIKVEHGFSCSSVLKTGIDGKFTQVPTPLEVNTRKYQSLSAFTARC